MKESSVSDLSIKGFKVGAAAAGMKKGGALDVCCIVSDRPCTAGAVFTRNRVVGEPVKVDRLHLRGGKHWGIVANAKISNVCTGKEGRKLAKAMCACLAEMVGCAAGEIFVASTGVIGQLPPLDKIVPAMESAFDAKSAKGWSEAARAIMTTDTRPKLAKKSVKIGTKRVSIGGIAKGSGMIHPNMATMLTFLATDAEIDKAVLQGMVSRVAERSFNCVTVDGDTSTSDTMIVLANGASGAQKVKVGTAEAQAFEEALLSVAQDLAKQIARDGEGAKHLITVNVRGARSEKAARQVAETVANSPLVKTAIAGCDANWGRIAAAAGRAGVAFSASNLRLELCGFEIFTKGEPVGFDEAALTKELEKDAVDISIQIGDGPGEATVWTCDLTHDYISINADYRT